VTNSSAAADKVALFRELFAGRTDVFPIRWENPKSGRTGYAPACANEWVRGVCGKPQVRCGECPNQSFIPVTDEVIEAHLRGEDRIRHNGQADFVAGVYPLLFDARHRILAREQSVVRAETDLWPVPHSGRDRRRKDCRRLRSGKVGSCAGPKSTGSVGWSGSAAARASSMSSAAARTACGHSI
jgi:hypothetical protein